METISSLVGEILPVFETWLRATVRDEMQRTLEADRQKAKPERNYSRDEVCALLHISKPTLWQKTKNGEIEATHIGRRVLYSETAVKRFLGEA